MMTSDNKADAGIEKGRLVVVLTRYWPTALSVIRSLGAAGYAVDLVASTPEPGASAIAAASKYVGRHVETVCRNVKRSDDPGLLNALLEYRGRYADKPVLFPTDDYTSSFADRNRTVLSDIFLLPSAGDGSDGAITALMNKHTQNAMAHEAGLLSPREWLIDLQNRDDRIVPEDMVYPCFCKPLESVGGFKGEMARCDDAEALIRHLEFLKERNPARSILVQEFLDIEGEIDIQGVCAGDKVCIPAVIRKSCVAEHEKGVTVAGTVVPADELGEQAEGVYRVLRACDYVGMFDMELNIAGGRLYFGEINFRSGGPNYAYFLSGVNLPAMAVRAIINASVLQDAVRPEDPAVENEPEQKAGHSGILQGVTDCCDEELSCEYGIKFVYEKVLWKEYMSGHMTKARRDKILREADYYLIGSSDDTAPTELFRREIKKELAAARKKRLRRAVGRVVRPLRNTAETALNGYPQLMPGNLRRYSPKPRVMVIGRNYCSNLCMARALGMAGYDVEIMRIIKSRPLRRPGTRMDKADILALMIPDAYSKYVKAYHTVVQKRGSRQIERELISAADKNRRMLLIPTEDVAAYIIDEYLERLSKYYHVPDAKGRQGEIVRLMSKNVQKQLAEEAGLPSAGSKLISIRGGSYDIPDGISYPCFIKPDTSRLTSKKRMRRCDTPEELAAVLDEAAGTIDLDFLVEDYVEIKKELSLLGLCMDGEVIGPGLFEMMEGGHGARKGVSAAGRSIPLFRSEDNPSGLDADMMEAVRRFLAAAGYNGLFDIDLIETEDGRKLFVELNLRFGASGFVLTKSGLNLPGILADHVLSGVPVDYSAQPERTGVSFVSEKVLIEEYADGEITAEEMEAAIEAAEVHFIMDPDDPKPYKSFKQALNKLK